MQTAQGAARDDLVGASDGERGGLGDTLERIYSFRFTYIAIVVFIGLYIYSVRLAETLLDDHFQQIVEEAVVVTDLELPVALQIQARMEDRVRHSRWVTWGGVKVHVTVLGRDGRSWIYVGDAAVPPPPTLDPFEVVREAERLLPASADVSVVVPHNAVLSNVILVGWAGLLVWTLFLRTRNDARRQAEQLEAAMAARETSAERSRSIQQELAAARERLSHVEPASREQEEEIRGLEQEREQLQRQLAALGRREDELRSKNVEVQDLTRELNALEELLEEAGTDLARRDDAIRELETNLKRASRGERSRERARDSAARRLRTLYRAVDIDDKAVDDWLALRDEVMKLKAEEAIKRLDDDADNVPVRRKVGGLPPHLSIFELGFAGKGRIYYGRGKGNRPRILTIGAKNSQKPDLEYLSRLKEV